MCGNFSSRRSLPLLVKGKGNLFLKLSAKLYTTDLFQYLLLRFMFLKFTWQTPDQDRKWRGIVFRFGLFGVNRGYLFFPPLFSLWPNGELSFPFVLIPAFLSSFFSFFFFYRPKRPTLGMHKSVTTSRRAHSCLTE